MVIGLLGNPDSLLQSQISLLTEEEKNKFIPSKKTLLVRLFQLLNLLVAKATVQACQVERSIAEASTVAFVSVALALITGQNEAVKIMQETVG